MTFIVLIGVIISLFAVILAYFSVYVLIKESKYWTGTVKMALTFWIYSTVSFLVAGLTISILTYVFRGPGLLFFIVPQILYFIGFLFSFISVWQLKKFSLAVATQTRKVR